MSMQYTYWQEPDGMYLGYMNEYPDYVTQGHSLDELRNMLRDILQTVRDGTLPDTRHHSDVLEFS